MGDFFGTGRTGKEQGKLGHLEAIFDPGESWKMGTLSLRVIFGHEESWKRGIRALRGDLWLWRELEKRHLDVKEGLIILQGEIEIYIKIYFY